METAATAPVVPAPAAEAEEAKARRKRRSADEMQAARIADAIALLTANGYTVTKNA